MLDVPCSGTGVLRRNPDIRWKFTTERVQELSIIQSLILEESLQFVKPKTGKIVYSTCSVLPQENLQQVIKFCEKHGYEIENGAHFTTLPKHGGMDGFFSATLVPQSDSKKLKA